MFIVVGNLLTIVMSQYYFVIEIHVHYSLAVSSLGHPGVIVPSSEYMEIPVKAFEMIHLHAYQHDFITAFSKSATLVDTQLALAQHSQREVEPSLLPYITQIATVCSFMTADTSDHISSFIYTTTLAH